MFTYALSLVVCVSGGPAALSELSREQTLSEAWALPQGPCTSEILMASEASQPRVPSYTTGQATRDLSPHRLPKLS